MLPFLNQNHFIPNLIYILEISYQLICNFRQSINKKKISSYNLLCLLKKFMTIEFIAYYLNMNLNLIKKDSIEELFIINFNTIKEYFNAFICFNNNIWKSLSLKINNLFIFSEYIYNIKFNNNSNISLQLENILKNSNFNLSEGEIKVYLSEEKNNELHLIKSLSSNWYKCSNDHLNEFEKDKNLNQNIICSECHEKIGNLITNIQNKRFNIPKVSPKIEKKNNSIVNFFSSFFKTNNNNIEKEKKNYKKLGKENNLIINKTNNFLNFPSNNIKYQYKTKVLLKEIITKNITEKIIYTNVPKPKKIFLNLDYFCDYKIKDIK